MVLGSLEGLALRTTLFQLYQKIITSPWPSSQSLIDTGGHVQSRVVPEPPVLNGAELEVVESERSFQRSTIFFAEIMP